MSASTVEPHYCGHIGTLPKCPHWQGVHIGEFLAGMVCMGSGIATIIAKDGYCMIKEI